MSCRCSVDGDRPLSHSWLSARTVGVTSLRRCEAREMLNWICRVTWHLFSLQVDQSSAAARPQEALGSTSLRSDCSALKYRLGPSRAYKQTFIIVTADQNQLYTYHSNMRVVVLNLFTDWLVSSLPLCRKTRCTTLVSSSAPPALKSGDWLERRSHTLQSNCQTAADPSVPL